MNYYNENDPKAAAWLRELIKAKHIALGDVDERSIEDVLPNDLKSYTQCHFFAGIGGWSYALRLAGWPDDLPVWTGSCPCQPFSLAGKGDGVTDERHLWPAWFHLCRICKPERIFGEQVANALSWFDLVSSDLESEGYAVGAAIMGAHSVGAPHRRQRLYWVGHSVGDRLQGSANENVRGAWRGEERGETGCASSALWADCEWLPCADGKARPVEPGTFPLAHGVPNRVGLLRGYGNAIVPQVAAAFVTAYLDTLS